MQLNLILPTLAHGDVYHVYCSIYNEGAEQLFQEAMHVCGKAWHMSDVQVCTDRAHLAECNCFILYLNARTWSNGALSKDMLEGELEEAMEAGVQLCLAHEMPMFAYPGSSWDQINPVDGEMLTASSRTRHACDFGDFFVLTPRRLLEQKLYNTIATPLKRWTVASGQLKDIRQAAVWLAWQRASGGRVASQRHGAARSGGEVPSLSITSPVKTCIATIIQTGRRYVTC